MLTLPYEVLSGLWVGSNAAINILHIDCNAVLLGVVLLGSTTTLLMLIFTFAVQHHATRVRVKLLNPQTDLELLPQTASLR